MKRKRAIKLIMAADGNGEKAKAAKILDLYCRRYAITNERAVYKIVDEIAWFAFGIMDKDTFCRAQKVLAALPIMRPRRNTNA